MVKSIKSVHVIISGRVQGVYYRNWTVENARKLGLIGWVRNRIDGSVEAVFSGDESAVLAMIDACWQGPTEARVDSIEASDCEAPTENSFFKLATV